MVCPGVSSASSSTVLPTLMTSPAPESPSHIGDLVAGVPVREDLRAGFLDEGFVSPCVVAVLVRVQDLGDRPAFVLGGLETLLVVEGIDGKRLARLAARDQVVEIAVGVRGPDLLDDHGVVPGDGVLRSRIREVTQATLRHRRRRVKEDTLRGRSGVASSRYVRPFFELRARLAASARPSSAGACAASRSTSSRNHATKA